MTEIEALKLTMEHFGINRKEMLSRSHKRKISDCKAVLCWWYVNVLKLNKSQASLRFLRNPSFAQHNLKKVESLKKEFKPILDKLIEI